MRRLALAIALVLLVPMASADHVFSHRLYVVGRALDASGLPAPGFPIDLAFENATAAARCFDDGEEITGPRGDFAICRHTHALPPNVTAILRIADTETRLPVDRDLRHAWAHVQLAGHAPARDLQGDREFNATFTVAGRAFNLYSTPQNVEGVLVNATPRGGDNVSARIVLGNGTLAQGNATVDEHGRYVLDLEIGAVPPDARVRVEVAGKLAATEASPLFRRADVDVVRDLRSVVTIPTTARPGSETPIPAWVALAALALTGAAARRRR